MSTDVSAVLRGERRWAIVRGDCFTELDRIAADGQKVDHILADPPYSERIHAAKRTGRKGPTRKGDGKPAPCSTSRAERLGFEHITQDQRQALSRLAARIVRRWTLAFCDVEAVGSWRDALVEAGMEYVRTGAWVKTCATPEFRGDRPASGFEAVAIAHAAGEKKRWNGGGGHAVWTHAIELNRRWRTPRLHTTQKPLPLMVELASLFVDADEVVLDPFCGSGTTGVAALRRGARFVGIELDESHAATAADRLAAEERGSSIDAERRGQLALLR